MNALLANSFTTFFVNLFSNWQLVLFIVLTIFLLLAIFFKRFKVVFLIFLLSAIGIGVTLLTLLIISALQWDIYELIDFLIAWVPTILFSLIVVLSTLVNARRGRRKSLIFLAQSTGAAILWVLLFYFGAKSARIDAALVKFVNLFLGENGLQNLLNVSTEVKTLRGIFTLYLQSLGGGGSLGILLGDTAAYLYTLADMVYHILFALLCYFFYLLTVFILYIIYLCAYSERKYKRKKQKAFNENRSDTPYKKHRIAGGFVGLARGIVTGLMCMSFIGAGFYMLAGGRGEGKMRDYDVSGKYEAPLRIYRSIESYGTHGIFLILNAMSDPNDVPYYLFAADLVFSGALNDEHNDISEDVYLTKELGSLSGLARDTIELLLKHGSEEITGAINGTSETSLMNSILTVMKKRAFQEEFDLLIAQFDSPTYVYNFSMSLVSSVLANIDSMSFGASLGEKNKELVKIMFKEGYLSSYIPEDCKLHDINLRANAEDPWLTSGKNVRPYLGLQQLVTKEDFRTFLSIFLNVLTDRGNGTTTFDLVRNIIPKVKTLSLFDSKKVDTIDPVFARVYCYLQNAYLKAEGASGYSYTELVAEEVKWTAEIVNLLDVADDFFEIYDDVKDAEIAVFNQILYIFDPVNPNRKKDVALYDKIEENLSSSRILGKTLATSFFRKTLTDGLGQLFESLYIPSNTVYETTFKQDGSVEKYGELHYFLKGLRHIGCMDNQSLFELLFGDEQAEIVTILDTIADAMAEKDADGHNFAYYISKSDLFRSVISCFLLEGGEEVLYVPKASFDRDEKGAVINVIRGDELEGVLNSMRLFADFIRDCAENSGGYYEHIDGYLDRSDFRQAITTNGIIEGSLARLVKERFADEQNIQNVIVPQYLKDDVENWCSGASGGSGELIRFINAYLVLRDQAEVEDEEGGEGYKLSLKTIVEGNMKDVLLTTASHLGQVSEQFLASDIIYYTVSNYLANYTLNNLTVVVPLSARTALHEDVLESVVKREELTILLTKISELAIDDDDGLETTGKSLLKKLVSGKQLIEGEVLSASVVATIAYNSNFVQVLKLDTVTVSETSTDTYQMVGAKDYLTDRHYSTNPWSKELPRLLDALTILFSGQVDEEDFEFSNASFTTALINLWGNTAAIEVCRSSHILTSAYPNVFDLLDSMQGEQQEDDEKDDDDGKDDTEEEESIDPQIEP